MIEETIQAIIVSALAIAPFLYIFLRRWAARNADRRNRAPENPELKDLERIHGAIPPGRRSLARRFTTALRRRSAGVDQTPTDPNAEPRPIFDRLRETKGDENGDQKRRRGSNGLSDWQGFQTGADIPATSPQKKGTGKASAAPPVASVAAERSQRVAARRSAAAKTWRRVERLPTLKRAIVLREILGPPKGFGGPPEDSFR